MKIEIIKHRILSNYKLLSQTARVPQTKETILPVWGLVYKKGLTNGLICQEGMIKRNNTSINIDDCENIKLGEKPFYLTWKGALRRINNMLESTMSNLDNEKVVTKNIVNILCFPEELVKRIAELACEK